jgi:hypothetical protein
MTPVVEMRSGVTGACAVVDAAVAVSVGVVSMVAGSVVVASVVVDAAEESVGVVVVPSVVVDAAAGSVGAGVCVGVVVVGAAAGAADADAGRAAIVPTSSETTVAFAYGSFGVLAAEVFGCGATCVCVSLTTGTRTCRTVGTARVFCACGIAAFRVAGVAWCEGGGSGARRLSFGTFRSGGVSCGRSMPGSAVVGAATAGTRNAPTIGTTYSSASTSRLTVTHA